MGSFDGSRVGILFVDILDGCLVFVALVGTGVGAITTTGELEGAIVGSSRKVGIVIIDMSISILISLRSTNSASANSKSDLGSLDGKTSLFPKTDDESFDSGFSKSVAATVGCLALAGIRRRVINARGRSC